MDGGAGVGRVADGVHPVEAVVAGAALLVLGLPHHVPQLGGQGARPGAAGVA